MVSPMNSPRTEQTPLLHERRSASNTSLDEGLQSDNLKPRRRSEFFILAITILAILTIGTGDELQRPAQTRIYESIYCRQYYSEHDPSLIGSDGGNGVAEEFCKNHVIQGEVAMLRGWQLTIEAFVMLLVSVPWGYAADTWGRKPVLVILMIGLFLRAAWIQLVCWFWWVFPIKAVWFSAMSSLLGGGAAITIAIVFTMITDVFPSEQRASRFFQIAGTSMATQVVGPFGSAALMRIDPWIPMLLGLMLQFIVILQVLLLPETKGYMDQDESEEREDSAETTSTCSDKISPLQDVKQAIRDSIAFLAADMRLLLLMPAFFMHMLIAGTDVLLQYVSTRYSLPLANATLVLTLRSACILALMILFYPTINHVLRKKFRWHPQRVDLILSRFCVVATGLGFLLIALSPSLPLLITAMAVNTLGSGLHLYLRSLATSFVEPHHVARLMTFVSWIDTSGLMIASPLLAWLFERGVERGGIWMGLPWLFTAAVFGIVAVLIGMISLSGPQLDQDEQEPLVGSSDTEGL